MRLPPGAAALLAGAVARPLVATWRYRWRDAGDAGRGDPSDAAPPRWRAVRPPLDLAPAVYAAWHEHLLPLAFLYRGTGVVALVSGHRDGEILARVLARLGYGTARGSSTRGGEEGFEEMLRSGRAGRPLAFTPDGPRGPARRCKPGVVRAAAETGLPVVPVAAAASPARRLGSWDRFLVPWPGARVHVSHGPALEVPRSVAGAWRDDEIVDEDSVAAWTHRVESALEAERTRCESAVASGRRGRPEAAGGREPSR